MKKFLTLTLVAAAALTLAAKEINLGLPTMEKNKGWSVFFQHAKGTATPTEFRGKKCVLLDVTSLQKVITNISCNRWFGGLQKVTALRLTFYTEDTKIIVLRVMDSTKQTHQFYFHVKPGKEWQTVTFKLDDAFRKLWYGGPKDKVWHAPAKMAAIVVDVEPKNRVRRDDPQAKFYVAEFTAIGE